MRVPSLPGVVRQVDVAQPIAEELSHLDQIVSRHRGVRRVEHEMWDAGQLVEVLVRVEQQRSRADVHGEHVLHRDGDARALLNGGQRSEQPPPVRALPAVRRGGRTERGNISPTARVMPVPPSRGASDPSSHRRYAPCQRYGGCITTSGTFAVEATRVAVSILPIGSLPHTERVSSSAGACSAPIHSPCSAARSRITEALWLARSFVTMTSTPV